MQISIDNKNYTVTTEIINQFMQLGTNKIEVLYSKLDAPKRLALQAYARKYLYDAEKVLRDKGDTVIAKMVRPGKKDDPVMKMLWLYLMGLEEMLQNVELAFESNNDDLITNLTFKFPNIGKAG